MSLSAPPDDAVGTPTFARRARWKLVAIGTVCISAFAVATACSEAPAHDNSAIKIGVLDPLSGPNASQGEDALRGALLAAEVINNGLPDNPLPIASMRGVPNLGGRKIKIVQGDTAGANETGQAQVDRLVRDEKVVALSGAYQSGVTLATAKHADRYGIPYVNGDSSAPSLTQQSLSWFFRTGPSDRTFGEAFLGMLKDQRDSGTSIKKVAILYTDDQFGNDAAQVTKDLASPDKDYAVVADVKFDPKATDLTSQVQKVRAGQPDVLFVAAYSPTAKLLLDGLRNLDYMPPALLAYGAGFADPQFVKNAGDRLTGMFRRVAWSQDLADKVPATKQVSELFRTTFKQPMTETSARTFQAVVTIALAINEARSTEPDKIRVALSSTKIQGTSTILPWDGVSFDENRQNTGARGVVEQYVEGQWRAVYPREVALRPVTWPGSSAGR